MSWEQILPFLFICSWYSPGYTSLLSLQRSSGTACRHVVSFNSYTHKPPRWHIINDFEWMFGLKATQHFYIYRLNGMELLKLCCQKYSPDICNRMLIRLPTTFLDSHYKQYILYIFVTLGLSNTCLSWSSFCSCTLEV